MNAANALLLRKEIEALQATIKDCESPIERDNAVRQHAKLVRKLEKLQLERFTTHEPTP